MAVILRPKHITALWLDANGPIPMSDRTPERYRQQLAEFVTRRPAMLAPVDVLTPMEAYVGAGAWRIKCPCSERTHVDPEWGLSCCFGCAATYTNIVLPHDWQIIDALLAKRRIQGTRNWEAPETLTDLIAEQLAHGEPV